MEKIYLHYDMDAFFAAVEQRDNPKLRGKAIAVGHGIITTASYEARKYGVKSAMSAIMAKKLCPHLIFVSVDKNKYSIVGKKIQRLVKKVFKKYEFMSIDEGYIDITEYIKNSEYENNIEKFINRFKKYIYKNVNLTCSVGIGFDKISAKIASDIDKPNGHFVFENREKFLDYIFDKKISIIPGIGKKTIEYLKLFNITKICDLYKVEKEKLVKYFGDNRGEYIYEVIRGKYTSEIDNSVKKQSYGHEITFNQSMNDIFEMEDELKKQAIKLSKRLKDKEEFAKTITLKIRYSNFTTYTKSKTINFSTNKWEEIYIVALNIYKKLEKKDEVRLIGIHVSSITKSKLVQLTFEDLKKMNEKGENDGIL